MKIAVCLFGLTGGSKASHGVGKSLDPENSYKNYQEMLFQDHDIDYFAHSWSVGKEQEIINLYNPKRILVEDRLKFEHISFKDYNIKYKDNYKSYFEMYSKINAELQLTKEARQCNSRWLSVKKSISMMREYKEKYKINYDFVIQLRYDLYFRNKIHLHKGLIDKFICISRPFDNYKSVHDFIFISSYKDALNFSTLYDKILEYSIISPFASKEHLDALAIEPYYYIKLEDISLQREYLKSKWKRDIKSYLAKYPNLYRLAKNIKKLIS